MLTSIQQERHGLDALADSSDLMPWLQPLGILPALAEQEQSDECNNSLPPPPPPREHSVILCRQGCSRLNDGSPSELHGSGGSVSITFFNTFNQKELCPQGQAPRYLGSPLPSPTQRGGHTRIQKDHPGSVSNITTVNPPMTSSSSDQQPSGNSSTSSRNSPGRWGFWGRLAPKLIKQEIKRQIREEVKEQAKEELRTQAKQKVREALGEFNMDEKLNDVVDRFTKEIVRIKEGDLDKQLHEFNNQKGLMYVSTQALKSRISTCFWR